MRRTDENLSETARAFVYIFDQVKRPDREIKENIQRENIAKYFFSFVFFFSIYVLGTFCAQLCIKIFIRARRRKMFFTNTYEWRWISTVWMLLMLILRVSLRCKMLMRKTSLKPSKLSSIKKTFVCRFVCHSIIIHKSSKLHFNSIRTLIDVYDIFN